MLPLRACLLIAAASAAVFVVYQPAMAQGAASSPLATSPLPSRTTGAEVHKWSSLTPQQRTILAPLEREWGGVDAPRRTKWIEVATRFPAMPAADQQRVQERMAEWARMTPTDRGRARLTFQETKQLSSEQKQARWEAYQALPDEQRKALALRSKPADERPRGVSAAASGVPLAAAGLRPVPTAARPAASAALPKQISPTEVQAKPGATTTLMTAPVEPPPHHRPGQPKIAARPGQVNPSTLLPQSGAQASASAPGPRAP